ncbi:MAG: hypothetical protein JOZ49_11755 [Mycolicibacterium sp.]|nr:hypothetical protein [Mycolicibacterium sp.]
MWVRFVGAPSWVCWLVTALLVALFLAPTLAVPAPDVAHSPGWASGLVILGIYSLVFAAVATALQRPPLGGAGIYGGAPACAPGEGRWPAGG